MPVDEIIELYKRIVQYDSIPVDENDDFFCFLSVPQPLLREIISIALESVLTPQKMQEIQLDMIFDEVPLEKKPEPKKACEIENSVRYN